MTDQPRHITAQVSNGDGSVTNDVVIDTETGESVALEPLSGMAKELLDLFGLRVSEVEEGDNDDCSED